MRPLGKLFDPRQAHVFCDFLYVKGIETDYDEDDHQIWVLDEDQLGAAADYLARFKDDPDSFGDRDALQAEAETRREAEVREEARAAKRTFTGGDVFSKMRGGGFGLRNRPGPLTLGLIIPSVLISFLGVFGQAPWVGEWLYIAGIYFPSPGELGGYTNGLRELFRGQVWRLITPIFIHMGVLHLLFNMWWLADLGAIIERRRGWRRFLLLVLVSAAGSNLAQYAVEAFANPEGIPQFFGGMSGVVYALLGYCFVKAFIEGERDYALPNMLVYFMMGWLVLGFIVPGMRMANWAHLGGLLIGYGFAQIEGMMDRQG